MKIMYCKIEQEAYEEITLEELKKRASLEYQEQNLGCLFAIILNFVEEDTFYFVEEVLCDY